MHVATSPSRGPNTTERHRTIVVGYDGSSEAQAALAAAARRAGKGGTVVAVYAAEPASKWLDTPHYFRAVEIRRERAASVFDALRSVEPADVTVEAELVDGPVPEALAEVAKLRDADEITVGSRRLGWLGGALSSVSRRVLRIADRPVVVVPRMSAGREPARRSSDTSAIPLPGPISAHNFRF
ncbi:MAG TPA: universal stress protein [Solirubrobacteraceae bacterium]|nr:universal stress protein [Solirubrobacteraceae bacterium]